jgi:putative DNA primase/helicase
MSSQTIKHTATPNKSQPAQTTRQRHYYDYSVAETPIPRALRRRPQWMGTRFEPRSKEHPDKMDKPPYRVRESLPVVKASKTDPQNWSSFEEAVAAYERGDVDAIGFVVVEDDPFFVADADEVVDLETGEVDRCALEVIHTMATYVEFSCSGRGVHIIGRGKKRPGARCKSTALGCAIEVYDAARFVIVTGKRFPGTPADIHPRQRELDELGEKLWPEPKSASGRRFSSYSSPSPASLDITDEALLERARRARGTGPKFRRLFDHGESDDYASPSEADFSLLNMLVFWTAGDRERVIHLFEQSALYRKEKHRSYVELSTDNALESYSGSFYRPRRLPEARKEKQGREPDPLDPYLQILLDPSLWRGRKGASAFKAYAGAVALAAERGIVDDGANLRIGCDVRSLAERSGMERETLRKSALPYLTQQMGLIRWRRGKGQMAGEFVLRNPQTEPTDATKVSTHFSGVTQLSPKTATTPFSVVSQVNPGAALDTLKLLIRMRGGRSKRARLPRLGMVAMFVCAALCCGSRRGQSVEELAEHTGRRKTDLRKVCKRLVSADVAEEVSEDFYRLTDGFNAEYERELEESGITYSERRQRRRHAEDRRARDEEMQKKRKRSRTTPSQRKARARDAPETNLKGSEKMKDILEERRKEERARWVEEQRQKVGATAATFLADELRGVSGCRWAELRERYHASGGDLEELWRAVHHGPWEFRRERDGGLYVYREASTEKEKRVRRLVYEGMSEEVAREEVYGGGTRT